MEKLVEIQGTSIQTKEYKGKRVVIFKDIDIVHQRPLGTASRNFRENRERFVSGVDFFKINQPDEIRRIGITRPQGGVPSELTLITESGYLLLVKSLTDDLAWKVQRELVDTYFRTKDTEVNDQPQPQQLEGEIYLEAARILSVVPDCKTEIINCLRNIIPNIDGKQVNQVAPVEQLAEQIDEQMVKTELQLFSPKTNTSPRGYAEPFNYKKLDDYLFDHEISNITFAEKIGCSNEMVSRWRRGVNSPGRISRNRICKGLELPGNYFDKPARRSSRRK